MGITNVVDWTRLISFVPPCIGMFRIKRKESDTVETMTTGLSMISCRTRHAEMAVSDTSQHYPYTDGTSGYECCMSGWIDCRTWYGYSNAWFSWFSETLSLWVTSHEAKTYPYTNISRSKYIDLYIRFTPFSPQTHVLSIVSHVLSFGSCIHHSVLPFGGLYRV
jgi:hypothetical protein